MLKFLIIIFTQFILLQNRNLIFKPQWANQGAGAKVIRIVGNSKLPKLDPFLMLDYFNVKLPAGFPDHPHRGFQTVTYMIKGSMLHEDFKGHRGQIKAGDLQWMTAGRGIIHSQMPSSFTQASIGFQLWINLRSNNKMIEPQYQQYSSDKIPVIKKEAVIVKIISGNWEDVSGPIVAKTPAYYFDIEFTQQKSLFQIDINKGWNSIIFVYQGKVNYLNQIIDTQNVCLLTNTINVHKITGNKAKFILIAGEPLNEPIESYGPFVMNTRQEIQKTFEDYQFQKNGFQGSRTWKSEIQYLSKSKENQQL